MTAATLTLNDLTHPASAALLAERRASLVKFVRSKVRDLDVAEDLVQDVFYQLVRSVNADDAIEDVGAWLYHAARNKIIDWYRKRKSERMTDEIARTAGSMALSGESDLERQTIWNTFLDALATLPEKQRDVFVMHELEGFSFNEIAEITGENLNTLLARKRYAVLGLRKRLKHLR
jgi:RNA polymerase sigma factor (sigma-70 family)